MISESIQPIVTEPIPQDTTNPPHNIKLLIIVIVAILLGVGAVVVGLIFGGVITFGNTYPNAELAKSVCEEHGGIYKIEEEFKHYCNGDKSAKPFNYVISFSNQEKISDYQKFMRSSSKANDITILENSDEFIKIYASPSKNNSLKAYVFSAMYKEAIVELEVLDGMFGEDLLAELGFPDRSRETSYTALNIDKIKSIDETRSDAKYREDLSGILSLLQSYQANNKGQLPKISNGELVGFDSYLETEEIDYSITGFESLESSGFADDDTPLYKLPSNQIYVFYSTKCSEGALLATDRARSVALVHSYADNSGYFCYSD